MGFPSEAVPGLLIEAMRDRVNKLGWQLDSSRPDSDRIPNLANMSGVSIDKIKRMFAGDATYATVAQLVSVVNDAIAKANHLKPMPPILLEYYYDLDQQPPQRLTDEQVASNLAPPELPAQSYEPVGPGQSTPHGRASRRPLINSSIAIRACGCAVMAAYIGFAIGTPGEDGPDRFLLWAVQAIGCIALMDPRRWQSQAHLGLALLILWLCLHFFCIGYYWGTGVADALLFFSPSLNTTANAIAAGTHTLFMTLLFPSFLEISSEFIRAMIRECRKPHSGLWLRFARPAFEIGAAMLVVLYW